MDIMLRKYCLLANDADRRGKLLWPTVPKHHWAWHLAYRSFFLNPRRGNTSIDETYLGYVKCIVQSVASGTRAELIPDRFVEKYLLGMHFQLEHEGSI